MIHNESPLCQEHECPEHNNPPEIKTPWDGELEQMENVLLYNVDPSISTHIEHGRIEGKIEGYRLGYADAESRHALERQAMKAKDTVMSDAAIEETYSRNYGSGGFDEVEFGRLIAQAQAYISFKAGIEAALAEARHAQERQAVEKLVGAVREALTGMSGKELTEENVIALETALAELKATTEPTGEERNGEKALRS